MGVRVSELHQVPLEEQDLEIGETDSSSALREFGPYRVIRLLGEGGMGIVYLADRKDLGSLVAEKALGTLITSATQL